MDKEQKMKKAKMDLEKLKDLIEKGTMMNAIDVVQLVSENGNIKTSMVSNQRDVVVLLDIPNDLCDKHGFTLNFAEPNITVMPYIKNIDTVVPVKITKDHLIIMPDIGQIQVPFCNDNRIQNNILYKIPKDDFEYFGEIDVDENHMKVFDACVKLGKKLGKVYVTVDRGKLYIGVGDKTNQFAPGFKSKLCKVDHKKIVMCFDYKNFVNLYKVMCDDYKMKFAYIDQTAGGLIHVISSDGYEQYILLNREI
jgi:hypothetical protein